MRCREVKLGNQPKIRIPKSETNPNLEWPKSRTPCVSKLPLLDLEFVSDFGFGPRPRLVSQLYFWLVASGESSQAPAAEWTAVMAVRLMENVASLKAEIKKLLVDNLMLQITVEGIADDQVLFGPEGLGLDSVDALQLVVALDKQYGLKIPDPAAAQVILRSVTTIADAIQGLRASQSVSPTPQPKPD
jgi:acyl carrier protein